jgi:hypothetical protein
VTSEQVVVPDEPAQDELRAVLDRVVSDAQFRRLLLDDPKAALAGYRLSEVQILLISGLDESDLEKLSPDNLDEYFAVDSAVYTPDDDTDFGSSPETDDDESGGAP